MTLLDLQRRVAGAIMAERGCGRRHMLEEAEVLIRPNSRLTSLERIEIYRQSYWLRVLDSLRDDFPGLSAVLGRIGFNTMAEAYLSDHPSQSFTMRNLGARLEDWLLHHPGYGGTNLTLALDMVKLEWAHIEAFDASAEKPLGPEDLLELGPDTRFRLQPHISLLQLQYPVDDLRIRVQAVKKHRGGAASNVLCRTEHGIVGKNNTFKPKPTFLAVHRVEFTVYYRRLAADEFRILDALRHGNPIGEVVVMLEGNQELVKTWFSSWSRLGWLLPAGHLKETRENNYD